MVVMLDWFYDISTHGGYLMSNPVYKHTKTLPQKHLYDL